MRLRAHLVECVADGLDAQDLCDLADVVPDGAAVVDVLTGRPGGLGRAGGMAPWLPTHGAGWYSETDPGNRFVLHLGEKKPT